MNSGMKLLLTVLAITAESTTADFCSVDESCGEHSTEISISICTTNRTSCEDTCTLFWCPGTPTYTSTPHEDEVEGFCSLSGCGDYAIESPVPMCNSGSSSCQNDCMLTWCTGSGSTSTNDDISMEDRVYDSTCLDYENCQCQEGNCTMPNCLSNCECNGGNCNMPSCFSNCACGGGDCVMPYCLSQCTTSGAVGLSFPTGSCSVTNTILLLISMALAVPYLMV